MTIEHRTHEGGSYHDSHPIHNVRDGLALKREGNTILVYPGPVRVPINEWASAVAFTSLEGETGQLHRTLVALLGEVGDA